MTIKFYKYQGTGNDFIMVNNMDHRLKLTSTQIQFLCDRKIGIGADGIILIEPSSSSDFYVNYYNSDGSQSYCGNGSRCSVAFSKREEIFSGTECTFHAIDGAHTGQVISDDEVKVSMMDVQGIERLNSDAILNTGSPHYVKNCSHLDDLDILSEARSIRYNDRFSEEGINVNFVEVNGSKVSIRTYERGVEDETLSCGTGVTAVALSLAKEDGAYVQEINAMGGVLRVSYSRSGEHYTQVFLEGKATAVYSGEVELA